MRIGQCKKTAPGEQKIPTKDFNHKRAHMGGKEDKLPMSGRENHRETMQTIIETKEIR